ncbi:hypothetical protein LTR36_000797 [Oleoguttula mirabilis]|uniref:Uncharacterized protein n=1 Tax=Oleoguttula mirabilis TaxID=1507867 RepID=A0AAV9J3Y5_9PEZI|nr:hypothetical protein LTR36_000797 [Oleoguttula mirabilis]
MLTGIMRSALRARTPFLSRPAFQAYALTVHRSIAALGHRRTFAVYGGGKRLPDVDTLYAGRATCCTSTVTDPTYYELSLQPDMREADYLYAAARAEGHLFHAISQEVASQAPGSSPYHHFAVALYTSGAGSASIKLAIPSSVRRRPAATVLDTSALNEHVARHPHALPRGREPLSARHQERQPAHHRVSADRPVGYC